MADKNIQDQDSKEYIREKIIKPPQSRWKLIKKILSAIFLAVIFGAVSGAVFAIVSPWIKSVQGEGEDYSVINVTIPRDSVTPPEETNSIEPTEVATTEPSTCNDEVGAIVESMLDEKVWSTDSIKQFQKSAYSVYQSAQKSLVSISVITQKKDLFDNPIENSGQAFGLVVATEPNIIILTKNSMLADATSLIVSIGKADVGAQIRCVDKVTGIAAIEVDVAAVPSDDLDKISAAVLGNSYTASLGEPVILAGSPLGFTNSMAYGYVSYINKNVSVPDANYRIIYTDVPSASDGGGILLNLEGQIIGWIDDSYKSSSLQGITAAIGISELKYLIEDMIAGTGTAYLGITGSDVTKEISGETGKPQGVYVTNRQEDTPSYNAGIQNGDIITQIGEKEISNMIDVQNALDEAVAGSITTITVMREGRDGFKEISFQLNLGDRLK